MATHECKNGKKLCFLFGPPQICRRGSENSVLVLEEDVMDQVPIIIIMTETSERLSM
jgi:hypothetical protein